MRRILIVPLLAMLGLGFWSSSNLVITEITSGDGCPYLGPVPACLVAFVSYFAMSVATGLRLLKPKVKWAWKLFLGGVAGAGILAIIGSLMEVFIGNICPVGPGGVPMCFVSLGMCIAIAICGWGAGLNKTAV